MNDALHSPETASYHIRASLKTDVAMALRDAAHRFILPRFDNLDATEVGTKSNDTDFVTIADKEAEGWLTPQLSAILPAPVIGEEAASAEAVVAPDDLLGYCWTVDPLDGTKNFVKGKPVFCSMVALLWQGVPIRSWIWNPIDEVLFYAAMNEGTWRVDSIGETRLQVRNRPKTIDQMIGSGNSLGLAEPRKSDVRMRLRTLRGRQFIGSAGVQACMIASNEADFMVHGAITPWDHAPVDLICREAGGHSATLDRGLSFSVALRAPYMAASSQQGWAALQNALWL